MGTAGYDLVGSDGGVFAFGDAQFEESLPKENTWLLMMVWIYNIAERKGRHAFSWLILGLFFALLALIVLVLMPSKLTTQAYPDQ